MAANAGGQGVRTPMLLSRRWVQVALLVFVAGFFGLGLSGYLNWTSEAPIPAKVVGPDGQTLFTHEQIMNGQAVFLGNGLMEYGTIYGHGAYLGPDFTADYLHRSIDAMRVSYTSGPLKQAINAAAPEQTEALVTAKITEDLKTNRYDKSTDTLTFTYGQVAAFDAMVAYYTAYFSEPTTKFGLRREAITTTADLHDLIAYFAWTAWAAAAQRPGTTHSYTANWPGRRRSATP